MLRQQRDHYNNVRLGGRWKLCQRSHQKESRSSYHPTINETRRHLTNGSTSSGTFVTQQPFPKLSKQLAEAETFQEFPTSLISVRKTADDGNISIFTKDGVIVHKEHAVLIASHTKAHPSSLENSMSAATTVFHTFH